MTSQFEVWEEPVDHGGRLSELQLSHMLAGNRTQAKMKTSEQSVAPSRSTSSRLITKKVTKNSSYK